MAGFMYLFTSTFSGPKFKLSKRFTNSDLRVGGTWWAFSGRGTISRIWLVAVGHQGGSGPKPPDVNELGQWSGQWRPPEPALVAATRARTMRRRRIRGLPDSLRQEQASSTTFLHLLVLLSLRPPVSSAPARLQLSIARRGCCCWFKPPQSVLGRGEAHMP